MVTYVFNNEPRDVWFFALLKATFAFQLRGPDPLTVADVLGQAQNEEVNEVLAPAQG